MRAHKRFLALVPAVALVVLALTPRAEAGRRWENFKRSPAKVGAAAAVGTVAVLHPVATAGTLMAGGAFAGGLLLGAAKLGVGLLAGGGQALLAAGAVSPLAPLVFVGATGYAAYKGGQWIKRKFQERRAGGFAGNPGNPGNPSMYRNPLRGNLGPMAGAQPAY